MSGLLSVLVCLICLWFFAVFVVADCCFCLLVGFIVLGCWLIAVFVSRCSGLFIWVWCCVVADGFVLV